MNFSEILILVPAGLFAGILAGFLGIGGGTVMVPILLALGYEPVQAVATSTLSIVITALSGSLQNWRMGYLNLNRVLGIGFPALITAQIGAYLAERLSSEVLLISFGCFLLFNTYLVGVRKRVAAQKMREEEREAENIKSAQIPQNSNLFSHPIVARIFTGSAAGLLAGMFGVGGGVIMVPLQIILLKETIKTAIQTSLGVIVITALSACVGHALHGNVLWIPGLVLGFFGLLSAQISTRFLPKLPEKIITFSFRTLLIVLALYVFWQVGQQAGG